MSVLLGGCLQEECVRIEIWDHSVARRNEGKKEGRNTLGPTWNERRERSHEKEPFLDLGMLWRMRTGEKEMDSGSGHAMAQCESCVPRIGATIEHVERQLTRLSWTNTVTRDMLF